MKRRSDRWLPTEMIKKICKNCHNNYLVHAYRAEKSSYCSRKCHDESLKGIAPKVDNRGRTPWIKGKKHTPETLKKMVARFYPKGEDHPSWVGDSVGYFGIHSWIERVAGKPKKCEKCGTTEYPKYEWANKSRNYKRDRSDWIRLCIPCHRKADYHRMEL